MPTYISLMNYTDQGIQTVRQSPRRLDAAKRSLEEMGGIFRDFFMTMGSYDLVLVYEAPDDAVFKSNFLPMSARTSEPRRGRSHRELL